MNFENDGSDEIYEAHQDTSSDVSILSGEENELPEGFDKNKDAYAIVTFVIIPLMVVGGFFFSSMMYGGLILSGLIGLMCLDAIIEQSGDEDRTLKTGYYSALIVFLSAWSPLIFFLVTPYIRYIIPFTAIWFSIGMYTIVAKYHLWMIFWKDGFRGLSNVVRKRRSD